MHCCRFRYIWCSGFSLKVGNVYLYAMIEFFKEFGQFLMERKKWWLIPVVLVLLLVIVLIAVGSAGGAASPFIYTIF